MSTPPFDLIARLAAAAPLSVAHYMELALQHPEYGYYRRGDRLGAKGDFTTAPEISQLFGELIGLWCVDYWQKLGCPDPFALCELGPGRGTMLRDALRAAKVVPAFLRACRLFLVESNSDFRALQAKTLAAYEPYWLELHEDLPSLPTIILANEFFDALPVRQFVRTAEGWRERCVGFFDGALRWTLAPYNPALQPLIPPHCTALPLKAIAEISVQAQDIMDKITRHTAAQSGIILIIDYGYETPSGKPSLQALSQHCIIDPLETPGEADLTAHVDFGLLAATAQENGLNAMPLLSQGEFLVRLGINTRAHQLSRQARPEQREAIHSSHRRLVDAEQMGTLFKVLCCVPDKSPIPGGY